MLKMQERWTGQIAGNLYSAGRTGFCCSGSLSLYEVAYIYRRTRTGCATGDNDAAGQQRSPCPSLSIE